MRRTRQTQWTRRLVQEHKLSADDLIWPLFLVDGENVKEPVKSMPGVDRMSVDQAVRAAQEAYSIGIPALALFPNTDASKRTPGGEEALNPDNLVCRTIQAVKDAAPDIGIVCDVALDPYTSHGHDGILSEDGEILNDATLEVLTQQALIQVQAGCDIIAPSDMMDGRIGAIRDADASARKYMT